VMLRALSGGFSSFSLTVQHLESAFLVGVASEMAVRWRLILAAWRER